MNRDDIIERMQPLIGQLADGLVALASDLARERVLAALEQMPLQAVGRGIRPGAKPKLKGAKRPAKATQATGAAGAKRTTTCARCGAVGFTAKTCGKTHNVAAAEPAAPRGRHASGPVEEDDAPAPDSKRDRFAKLEEAARRRRGGS